VLRSWLWLAFLFPLSFLAVRAAESSLPTGRLRGTFDGIECEYSPGQEELARALAVRFARHNEELANQPPPAIAAPAESEPLSVAEMRANRAAYLGRIAALLALPRPTALQEDCYDAFLANYEESMILFEALRTSYRSLRVVRRLTVWNRAELVDRLGRGEKITGMAYDPATQQGNSTYGGELAGVSDRLAELAEARQNMTISTSLNLETQAGVTNYRAHFDVGKRGNKPAAKKTSISLNGTEPEPAEGVSEWFPVVIPPEHAAEPPEQLVQFLWDGAGDGSVVKMMDFMTQTSGAVPRLDPQVAFLVLHETIEVGIIDRYFRGRDRRWFCDGVANYGAWSVLRDLHGEAVATQVHNLPAQLVQFADLRDQADLRKWPAVENESAAPAHSRLEDARYAFAEHAIALMVERGGKDALPRLFTEIGQTKPEKVSIKTVDKAWQKISGTKLDAILAEAVRPPPK